MSRYDLRFSVGVDQTSASKFRTQLDELTKVKSIPFKLDIANLEEFKKALNVGLETTIKLRVDTSELEKAINKYNLVDFNGITSTGDYLSKKASDRYAGQIESYKTLIEEFKNAEKELNRYGTKLQGDDDVFRNSMLQKNGDVEHDKAVDKFIEAREKISQLRVKIRSELAGLQNDERFQNEDMSKRFKSWERFSNSLEDARLKISNYLPLYDGDDSIKGYRDKFKELRSELQSFSQTNGIKSFIDIDKLSIDQLAEATTLLEQMEKINEKIVSLNGGNSRTKLKIGTTKEQTELFLHYRDAFNQQFENASRIMALSESQSGEQVITPHITTEALSDLSKTLASGLNNVPINSFAINPQAIETLRETIQTQLQNITIGKTITLTPNAKSKNEEDTVVLPNVVIGSVELSAEAITKLREDTQRALNNVALEPMANESMFSSAFERVSKTYQNKLNTIGRNINKAIQAPVIEEFDATPAIEKLKAQINEALKSFKFDINGRVAHGTISTGLDDQYQYAYRTYESLEKAVGKMSSGVNGNIAKLTGWGSTAGASDVLAQYNALLAKIGEFKTAYREMDAEGKLVMPIEEANKRMAELVTESNKLKDSFNNIATKHSIGKTLDNTANNITAIVDSMNKYEQTDEMKNVKIGFVGDDGTGGLLKQIAALKQALPSMEISEANTEMMKLLTNTEQLAQEFQTVAANTPLTRELERAATQATNLEKRLLNLQSRMQKAFTANSRGFSQPEFATRYRGIYEATQQSNLSGDDINRLDTQFKQLMRDMADAGQTGKSFGDIMRGMYAKFGSWTMVTMTLQRVISTFRQMLAAVRDVDTALTNLRKVTTATEGDLNRFMKGVGDSAYRMGSSISDLVNATAEFSRLGYDLNQAQKLGELATMYKTVAEDLDITTASQSIVSTLKAFEKQGVQAQRIVDVFNYVGNNFAISSAGIGEAMQRSAASLQTANNDLERSVALITAA